MVYKEVSGGTHIEPLPPPATPLMLNGQAINPGWTKQHLVVYKNSLYVLAT